MQGYMQGLISLDFKDPLSDRKGGKAYHAARSA